VLCWACRLVFGLTALVRFSLQANPAVTIIERERPLLLTEAATGDSVAPLIFPPYE
jgi:hypothetical protein